ncbi:MAG: hypothetical protein IH591_13535 [Bacteroidales bacterium]|nr:hypothetical protein [Bacteroidales bacterium]
MTEFVNNLKGELESTFKEEISVYFDINPHDGLLETHNVDKSLEGKLKCIIFIPILSQTYCDSNSYAWQNEFLAFIKMAENDHFGKDVRLKSGNVASRILPIRIHDLDEEDIKLFEKETGSVLRSMDFVFKTVSGVSRPLLSDEDHSNDNLDKTFYRDQINKVAHAIKEIILGMKVEADRAVKEKDQQKETIKEAEDGKGRSDLEKPVKSVKRRWFTVVGIIALLIVAAILAYPRIFKNKVSSKLKPGLEKSIAVLPFINDSPDTTYVYFINGIVEGIINNLSKIKDLKVLSRTSVEQYRNNKTKTIPQIAHELGVNYVVEGSGQKYGDQVMLSIQLLEASSDKHLFSRQYDRKLEDIFDIQSEIATSVATSIKAAITPEEVELIDKKPTSNMAALNMYLRADEFHYFTGRNKDYNRKAEILLKEAIRLDSTFANAYVLLGWVVTDTRSNLDSTLFLANQALHFDETNSDAYSLKGWILLQKELYGEAEDALKLAIKYNPNGAGYHFMGELYWRKGEYALSIENELKASHIFRDRRIYLKVLCGYLSELGFYEAELKFAEKLIKSDNDSIYYYWGILGAEMTLGDYHSALKTAMKYKNWFQNFGSIMSLYNWERDFNSLNLANICLYLRDYKTALQYVEEYIEMQEQQGNKINPSDIIGYVYLKNGLKENSVYHFEGYIKNLSKIIEQNQSNSNGSNYLNMTDIYRNYFNLFCVYSAMGEKDKAIENLRKVIKYNDLVIPTPYIAYLKNHPMFDTIRDEPEYHEFIKIAEESFLPERKKIEKLLQEEGIFQ